MKNKRTVLLSFLGASDYTACNYIIENTKSETVSYIQLALAKFYIQMDSDDRIIIMLTDTARQNNWENEAKQTLKDLLIESNLLTQTEIVNIPEGKSEDEIWSLFNLMFNSLRENDEIILDITHSFRSIPLLGTVLANYAGFVKNVKVRKICYGAFESLGSIQHVKSLPLEQRNVPVYDLVSFNVLQRWSFAAGAFTNNGIIRELTEVIRSESERIDSTEVRYRTKLSNLANSLETLEKVFITVRAKAIYQGDIFGDIISIIDDITERENKFGALFPILQRIKDKLSVFKTKSINNCFKAVDWYIENGMIPQGLTLLQESILAYFIDKHDLGKRIEDDKLSTIVKLVLKNEQYSDTEYAIKIIMYDLRNTKHIKIKGRQDALDCKDFLVNLIEDPLIYSIRDLYNRTIKKTRDDVSHGGSFRNSDKKYEKKLIDSYQKSLSILNIK